MDDVNCGRPAEEPLTISVSTKVSKDFVYHKEEFYLDIMADVQNIGKSMPPFDIKLCFDGVLDRVENKDNFGDCSYTISPLPDSDLKCVQVKGTCNNKVDEILLARLWFVSNKAEVLANFNYVWDTYSNGKAKVEVGKEQRTCDSGENGDADKNEKIEMDDYDIWKDEYFNNTGLKSDFNCDNKIDLLDFEIWRKNYFDNGNNIIPTSTPRPTECQDNEKKCQSNSTAALCINGFWKNSICANNWKCVDGSCEEVKCDFSDSKYSIGAKICKDRWTPSICRSNGLFEDGSECFNDVWCKQGVCVPVTCLMGDKEYKLGDAYCSADLSSRLVCINDGTFKQYSCRYGESCKDGVCIPDPRIPTLTPRPTNAPEPVQCYLPNGDLLDVYENKCIDGVSYYCPENGIYIPNRCFNGCDSQGVDCAI